MDSKWWPLQRCVPAGCLLRLKGSLVCLGGFETVEGFGVAVGVRGFDFKEGSGIEVFEVHAVEVEEEGEVTEVGGALDFEVDEVSSAAEVAEGEARAAVEDGDSGSAGGVGVSGEGVGADG